jgi:CheY-like chemotaxis protein
LPQQVETFRRAGMDAHVGKPFKREELLATINRVAAR